jgi:NADPH-dependent 2,4-dienoyl-CoA reductase/sulfur reductase-like enzyme/rhodanese-related sulfurtransferase
MKTIIVIGGLSAGPSAAAKARRTDENARIILFEKTAHISYATCGIPYAFSGKIKERDKLMVVKPELLEKRFNIEVHLNEEVTDIDPIKHIITTSKGIYHYDKLVMATGARSFVPPIWNLEKATNWSNCRTIEDYDKMIEDGMLAEAKNITILGGGLVGVEVAENLMKAGKNVTVVELAPHILPMWDHKFGYFAETVLRENGINVVNNTSADEVIVTGNKLTAVKLSDKQLIETDYLIVGIGARPNTELLMAKGAKHLRNGALVVNERMETSLPDIYAAGDCAAIMNIQTGEHDFFPLGTHSNKGGRAAGANASGGNEVFKGAYKTAIVKVFGYTLARTGFNGKSMDLFKRQYKSSFTITAGTPSFYPDPKDMFTEIFFEPETGEILGAEIFGEHGVDKRIDVLSTCIYAKLKVDDLPHLDLAYAPPFSPAKDPVIVAGYVAANRLLKGYRDIRLEELKAELRLDSQNFTLIDVRTPAEINKLGKIKGAINIEIDQLRNRLQELEKEKPIVLYCAKGMRGYISSTILLNHGFKKISNLSGGFNAWKKSGFPVEQNEDIVVA